MLVLYRAYNSMLSQIDGGVEFPDAHTNAVMDYDLDQDDAQELIDMYDQGHEALDPTF